MNLPKPILKPIKSKKSNSVGEALEATPLGVVTVALAVSGVGEELVLGLVDQHSTGSELLGVDSEGAGGEFE